MKLHLMKSIVLVLALGSLAMALPSCSAPKNTQTTASPAHAGSQAPSTVLTGVLTLRGAQIEAWWSLRTQDGKLWRLVASDPAMRSQLQSLAQQTVQAEGIIQSGQAAVDDFPTLKISSIKLVAAAN